MVPGESWRPQEIPATVTSGVHPPATRASALANAVRLLNAAELEIDLSKMDRYENLADSWINIAGMLGEHDYA